MVIVKKLLVGGLLIAAIVGTARADDPESLRQDAILLMGASLFPAGTAAYCNKYVEPNQRLIAAAAAWNKRYEAAMNQAVRVVEWTGGMSNEDKDAFDKYAFRMVKQSVESQSDRPGYCNHIAEEIEQGMMDLDTHETTAAAFARIMAAKIPGE